MPSDVLVGYGAPMYHSTSGFGAYVDPEAESTNGVSFLSDHLENPEALETVGTTWERLAQIDPLWAVLSEPDKRGGRWDIDAFLATGVAEIEHQITELRSFGLASFGAALDFGCGVGRLSIPLASHFGRVTGVDISPTMVDTARRLAADRDNVSFVVNDRPDLAMFDDQSIDLAYSNIVLQHMTPDLAASYIREFFRIVRPGGFVVFQIPSHLTEEWLPNSSDGTQLAEGLHRADIDVVSAPDELAPGETAQVVVGVRNASGGDWTQELTNQINVGPPWLTSDGAVLQHDEGRARLPGRVEAGMRCEVGLTVRAPDAPGEYGLEFDVVQEGVTWFASKGSPTCVHPVRVPAASGSNDSTPVSVPAAAVEYPTFMMRGIHHAEIERIVSEFGGDVLARHEHVTEWVSYRYVIHR